MSRNIVRVAVTLFALLPVNWALAAYPERLIRIIVAYPAGGSLDITARLLADKLKSDLGQTVIVESKPGAGGNIAAQYVAQASPDGYTILMTTSSITINPWMVGANFDALKTLVAITEPAQTPYVLVVGASLPAKTFDDFVTLAKTNPGKVICATYGVGSPPHLALELLKLEAQIDIVHAPYRGFGAELPDLMSGQISCAIDTPANVGPQVRAGSLRAIASTGKTEISLFPDAVPIYQKYQTVDVIGWQGVFLPANTPKPIQELLNAAFVKAVHDPEVQKRLRDIGFEPLGDSIAEASAVFKREYERNGKIIKTLNLRFN